MACRERRADRPRERPEAGMSTNPTRKVLGISAFFHDAAAAIAIDGHIVAAAEEERFSRDKHDASMPIEAMRFCLVEAGISADELDAVVFYEKPLRKFERLLVDHLEAFPRAFPRFSRALSTWLGKKLWVEADIAKALDVDPERILFMSHHLAHAASAFLPSPFSEAAVLTIDGVGEWATSGIFHGTSNEGRAQLTPLVEQRYPHSLGLLYSALTAYLGFEVNEGEYKVMGLAAYGEPRFRREIEQMAQVAADGTLTLDMRYFAFQRSPTRSFSKQMERLLGPSRPPHAAFDPRSDEGRRYADIARSLQAFTEDAVLAMARHALALTGSRNLCLAGGVALNSVANGRLARELDIDALYVHPAAGDAGGAVGAALYASHVILGVPREAQAGVPYLGPSFSDDAIGRFLDDCRIAHHVEQDLVTLDRDVARRLAQGQVGALFQGRAEWGPRALGARSILADPRHQHMTEFVNTKVKYREPFRPFAPAVLADEVHRWFELAPEGRDTFMTPYMLSVARVTPEGQALLPAITHVDGTARVQVVRPTGQGPEGSRFHALLERFREETGVGCLLNTSLNLKGEPLATTPAEAYAIFVRSGLDFLVLGNCLVTKRTLAGESPEAELEYAA